MKWTFDEIGWGNSTFNYVSVKGAEREGVLQLLEEFDTPVSSSIWVKEGRPE